MLAKGDVLRQTSLPTRDVDVPEWGGTVRVRTLTGIERDDWEAGRVKQSGKKSKIILANVRASLVRRCAVNEDGSAMFDETDELTLGRTSSRALDRVFAVCQELNGISEDSIEEAEKN